MSIPDNYDQLLAHERDRERVLAERPKCDICGEPIQDDHYYQINGDNVCPRCLNDEFRKEIDD